MNHTFLEKVIRVGDIDIRMRASALIPRLYRIKFGRDVVSDMNRLKTSMGDVLTDETNEKCLDAMDLTIFENIAYILAKHADPTVPEDPDDWLGSIPGVFSIYTVLPEIFDLWGINQETTSVPAKK